MPVSKQPKDPSHVVAERTTPCWDKECENLYRAFLNVSNVEKFGSAATALLSHLDQQRYERWNEAFNSIDFSHSSSLAWNTLTWLTSRLGHTSHKCSISANFSKFHRITSCDKRRSQVCWTGGLRGVGPLEGLNTRRSKELLTLLFAVYPLQDPQASYLYPC